MTSIASNQTIKKTSEENNNLRFASPIIDHKLPSNMRQNTGPNQFIRHPGHMGMYRNNQMGNPPNPLIDAPTGSQVHFIGHHEQVPQYNISVSNDGGQQQFYQSQANTAGFTIPQLRGFQPVYTNQQPNVYTVHPRYTAPGPAAQYNPPYQHYQPMIVPSSSAGGQVGQMYGSSTQFFNQPQYAHNVQQANFMTMQRPQVAVRSINTCMPPPNTLPQRTPSSTPGIDQRIPTSHTQVSTNSMDHSASSSTSQAAPPPKVKKILAIVDPVTSEVKNKEAFEETKHLSNEDKGVDSRRVSECRSEADVPDPSSDTARHTDNSSHNIVSPESVPPTPTPPSAQLPHRSSPSPQPPPPGDPAGPMQKGQANEDFVEQFAQQLDMKKTQKTSEISVDNRKLDDSLGGVSFGDFEGEKFEPSPTKQPSDPVQKIDSTIKAGSVEPPAPVVKEAKPKVVPTQFWEAPPPIIKKEAAIAKKEPTPPISKKETTPPICKKEPTPPVAKKEPTPPISKKEPTPPVAKETTPPIAKKETTPPTSKKEPTPPIVKEPTPPIVKEPTPPILKEPTPPVSKKEPTPPILKEPSSILKEPSPILKEPSPILKEPTPPMGKESTPPLVKKEVTIEMPPTTTVPQSNESKLVTNGSIPIASEDVVDSSTPPVEASDDSTVEEEPVQDVIGSFQTKLSVLRQKNADMWTPENVEGIKAYDKEYMDFIRDITSHLKREPAQAEIVRNWSDPKPNPLAIVYVDPTKRGTEAVFESMGKSGGRGNNTFNVGWQQPGMDRQYHPRHSYGGRQSGGQRGPPRGGNKPQQTIITRSSTQAEVKLNKSENAWKPLQSDLTLDEKDKHAKDVRAILNKVTPQTISDLSGDFLGLGINDSNEYDTINIIFDKCVEEPVFCNIYSQLCKTLVDTQKLEAQGGLGKSTFLTKLLETSQKEFERESIVQKMTVDLENKMAQATSEDEKKKFELELKSYVAKEKRRMLGIMKFIGELYKLGLLVASVMNYCVVRLLREGYSQETKKVDEDCLEALCKLLTTMGKKFENDDMKFAANPNDTGKERIQGYFRLLEMFTQASWRKENKVQFSSRVIFMIKDLIELRQNQWVPRRQETGPKKIDQIHNDAKLEKMEENQRSDAYEQQKQSRGQGGRSSQGGGGGQRTRGIPNRPSYERRETARTTDPSKLQQAMKTTSGSSTFNKSSLSSHLAPGKSNVMSFGGSGGTRKSWGQGATGGRSGAPPPQEQPPTVPPLMSRGFRGAQRDNTPKASPGSSRDSSQSREMSKEKLAAIENTRSMLGKNIHESTSEPSDLGASKEPQPAEMTDEERHKLESLAHTCVEDVLQNTDSCQEALDDMMHSLNVQRTCDFVQACLFYVLVTKPKPTYFHSAVKIICEVASKTKSEDSKNITQDIVKGFLKMAGVVLEEDLESDAPLIWKLWGGVVGELVATQHFQLTDFRELFLLADKQDISTKMKYELLAHSMLSLKTSTGSFDAIALPDLLCELAPDLASKPHLLQKLTVIVQPDQNITSSTPAQRDKPFVDSASRDVIGRSEVRVEGTAQEMELANRVFGDRLLKELWKDGNPTADDVMRRIEEGVSAEYRSTPQFISALAKHVFGSVITGTESDCTYNGGVWSDYSRLFLKYATTQLELERVIMDVLIKELANLAFPKVPCREVLNDLADSNVICRESFNSWKKDCEDKSVHGMFFCEGNIKKFFEDMKMSDDDTTPSSPEPHSTR